MANADKSTAAFEQEYDRVQMAVNQALEGYLAHDQVVPVTLRKAMLYSLHSGGKRLRPVMVILCCQACGGQDVIAMPAAAAMEMVHTYSLIHDDLPAMDNDDYRRGKPSSHKVFGDGIAILAGDALLTCAFHTLAQHVRNDALVRRLVLELADAAGAAGMIGGQVADLNSENAIGGRDVVNYIHTHKTAMMFRGAGRMGALCAAAEPQRVDMLGDYGLKLGLAFQIVDDLLDVTGTTEELGKLAQKDAEAGKLTYPSVVGMEESQLHARELLTEAQAALEPLGPAGEPLRCLADMLVNRRS